MKSLLITALMALSISSMAGQIITNYGKENQEVGFSESIFTHNYYTEADAEKTTFCYTGTAVGICQEIDKVFGELQSDYYQGAHETAEVNECTKSGDTFTVSYELYTDYDDLDLDITRKIKPCK